MDLIPVSAILVKHLPSGRYLLSEPKNKDDEYEIINGGVYGNGVIEEIDVDAFFLLLEMNMLLDSAQAINTYLYN